MTPTIYPKNTFYWAETLRSVEIVADEIREVDLEDGPVTAFLATSDSPTATAADASLVVQAVYTGLYGKWLVTIPGSVLTPELLESLFADVPPVLIVEKPGSVRIAVPCAYAPTRYNAAA